MPGLVLLTGGKMLENQLAELRWFATTQGWEIDKEYIDHVSGGRVDRREFQKLLGCSAAPLRSGSFLGA